jgi:hypothetical protein
MLTPLDPAPDETRVPDDVVCKGLSVLLPVNKCSARVLSHATEVYTGLTESPTGSEAPKWVRVPFGEVHGSCLELFDPSKRPMMSGDVTSRQSSGTESPESGRPKAFRCRGEGDRRSRPTGPLDAFRLAGRRARIRRTVDRDLVHFFDRFHVFELALIVSILSLTIVDGILTVELLSTDCEEANPLMKLALQQGHGTFFVVKYVLTALGLPFLLVFKNHQLFGTRFRVGYVFPIFLLLYLMLVSYEVRLFQFRRLRSIESVRLVDKAATTEERGPIPELSPCAADRRGRTGQRPSRPWPRRECIIWEKQALAWSEASILPQEISIEISDLVASTDVA